MCWRLWQSLAAQFDVRLSVSSEDVELSLTVDNEGFAFLDFALDVCRDAAQELLELTDRTQVRIC